MPPLPSKIETFLARKITSSFLSSSTKLVVFSDVEVKSIIVDQNEFCQRKGSLEFIAIEHIQFHSKKSSRIIITYQLIYKNKVNVAFYSHMRIRQSVALIRLENRY